MDTSCADRFVRAIGMRESAAKGELGADRERRRESMRGDGRIEVRYQVQGVAITLRWSVRRDRPRDGNLEQQRDRQSRQGREAREFEVLEYLHRFCLFVLLFLPGQVANKEQAENESQEEDR